MSKQTLQQKYAAGLVAMGFVEVKGTGQYRVFHRKAGVNEANEQHAERYLFLGKAGGVRVNSRRAVRESLALSETYKAKILMATNKEQNIMQHETDSNHPARSECTCGHTGDGTGSQHAGAIGHGPCMWPGCRCERFTWKRFLPADIQAKLKEVRK